MYSNIFINAGGCLWTSAFFYHQTETDCFRRHKKGARCWGVRLVIQKA
ncbi:hypothetical protein HDG36_004800 [Paraburkholderia sp. Kb1A]|nr:hypothetical protein [Paraburkholderia sp. Kb1A]